MVLIVDSGKQVASVAALVKGFRDHDPKIQIAGVVLNRVNSERHKSLLIEVLEQININIVLKLQ